MINCDAKALTRSLGEKILSVYRMQLLIAIAKHRAAWNKELSLAAIRRSIHGVVDIKLAQFLSNFELIIGEDLANEFRTLTHEAPIHSFEYSRAVVTEDFGDRYCLAGSTVVGSGSIAQLHQLTGTDSDIVIKVVHPHADEEIRAAVEAYRTFSNGYSLFISAKLKVVCNVFFDGMASQLDMRNEAANASHFPSTAAYICPKPLHASKRCLVMRYEPSIHLSTSEVSDRVCFDAYNAITKFSNLCLKRGWVHADMHEGNFGVRCKDGRFESVVIYDFGFVHDLSNEISSTIRNELAHCGGIYDFEQHKNALIKVLGIDEYDTEGMDLTPALEPFTRNMERLIFYYFTLCEITPTSFKLMSTLGKYYPFVREIIRLERKRGRTNVRCGEILPNGSFYPKKN